jgi:cytochrome c oxidase subunit 2
MTAARRRTRRAPRGGLAPAAGLGVLPAVMVAGCLPASATAEGRDVATLYGSFMALAAVVALVVIVPTTIAILRFRRRAGDDTLPTQTRGHLGLELFWTGLPALAVLGLFAGTFVVLTRVEATDAPRTTEIEVTAYRWGWSFVYPAEGIAVDGFGEPGPEVAVPVDEPITIRMTSADVIHSFFVPEFLFKRDANPGRQTEFQFTVEEPGAYRGQCAEFCGIYHARMPFSVLVMPRAEFETWLATTRGAGAGASPVPSPSLPGPSEPAAAPSDAPQAPEETP